MHGHTYRLSVEVGGRLHDGLIVDYAKIDEIMRNIVDMLDHRILNEIEGLENPTTELLVEWCSQQAKSEIARQFGPLPFVWLQSVEIDEGGHVARWIP